jgi:hypothetical protein
VVWPRISRREPIPRLADPAMAAVA